MNTKIFALIAQLILLSSLIGFFFAAEGFIDGFYFVLAIAVGLLSILLQGLPSENNSLLIRNPFTTSNLFYLAFSITFFQIPADYLLASFSDALKFQQHFYDLTLINKSVIFSSICLVSFNIGQSWKTAKTNSSTNLFEKKNKIGPVPINPFLCITLLLFISHLFTVNIGYYFGGKALLEGVSLIFHGYLLRFIVIMVFVVIWNSLISSEKTDGLFPYLKRFPVSFLVMIVIFSILTFMAADRGPVIRIMLLFSIGYFVLSKQRINLIAFVLLIVATGYFLSVIKLIGAEGFNNDFLDGFTSAQERFGQSDRLESISPFTLELAGSIYANNILFYLWHSGHSLYGAGVIAGVLMAFPGGVTLFTGLTGVSGEALNSSNLATVVSGESYGVGTTIIGDSLINLGFSGTIVSFLILGFILRSIDINLYSKKPDFKWLLAGFVLSAQIIALPRISMFNLIGVLIFDYIVIIAVLIFYKRLN